MEIITIFVVIFIVCALIGFTIDGLLGAAWGLFLGPIGCLIAHNLKAFPTRFAEIERQNKIIAKNLKHQNMLLQTLVKGTAANEFAKLVTQNPLDFEEEDVDWAKEVNSKNEPSK